MSQLIGRFESKEDHEKYVKELRDGKKEAKEKKVWDEYQALREKRKEWRPP